MLLHSEHSEGRRYYESLYDQTFFIIWRMKTKAKFVGDENPILMQAIKAENEKAKKAKAGHWIRGRWERRNGKLTLIIPRFIED